jgi:paraquat-inducible protein B
MKNMIKQNINSVKLNWAVWLFPAFAVIIAIFLFQQYFFNHGLTIKIAFDEASVIQPEKTRLRYRGVDIGTVSNVSISDDRKAVIVSVLLTKGTNEFAVKGSQFWIVTPKVSLQGLTGLDTIFAGPYIEVLPGPVDGEPQTEFKGRLEANTAADIAESTSSYLLETANAESVSTGDAVTFRGINVGSIGKLNLSKTSQAVEIQINIQNKYTRLIRTNTVFWRKVGIQAKLGLFGSKNKVNSLDSIMHGGVEFFTPDKFGEMAKANTKFTLVPEAPKDSAKWNPKLEL